MRNGPLQGIKIIDCTTVVAGPLCTQILADQGADVIKIEPFGGDLVRNLGPSLAPGFSAPFLALGRNKRSIAMDLSGRTAQDVVLRLIERADVFIANTLPGVMERHGLGAKQMQSRNQKLVYVSITGYGQTGPMTHQRAYDPIIQARSGMAAPKTDGQDARLLPQLMCDKVTGLTAAQAICAALIARANTGKGQQIDLSLLGASLAFLAPDVLWPIVAPDRDLPVPDITIIYKPWRTKNGQIVFIVLADKEFKTLLDAFNRTELMDDVRFGTMEKRFANWSGFCNAFKGSLAALTTQEALQKLYEANIPAGPVNRLQELRYDEQIKAIGVFTQRNHAVAGEYLQVAPGARFDNQDIAEPVDAPKIGQHSREILRENGFSEATVKTLINKKIVQ